MSKYLLTAAVILIFGVIITKIPPVYSQNSCTSAAVANDAVIQDVLVKSPVLNNSLLTSGNTSCAIDPDRTKIPSFSIPTFAQLKSVYFDQAKTTDNVQKETEISGDITVNSFTFLVGSKDQIHSFGNNLTLSAPNNPQGNKKSGLVFVGGNLSINNNIDYGDNTSGIVFIVQGNVYISPSVTEVNAIIVTLGKFCSSWNGSCTVASGSQPLTINGSIISLSQLSADKPVFNRDMADNTTPAEKIIFQPKYLVIMKNLLGKNINIWSEVQ